MEHERPQPSGPSYGEAELEQRMDVYGEETLEQQSAAEMKERERRQKALEYADIVDKAHIVRAELREAIKDGDFLDAIADADEAAKEAFAALPGVMARMAEALKADSDEDLVDPYVYAAMSSEERQAFIAVAQNAKSELFPAWEEDEVPSIDADQAWFRLDNAKQYIVLYHALKPVADLDAAGELWVERAVAAMRNLLASRRGAERPRTAHATDRDPAMPEHLRENAELLSEMIDAVPEPLREGTDHTRIVPVIDGESHWAKEFSGRYFSETRRAEISAEKAVGLGGMWTIIHEYAHGIDFSSDRLTKDIRERFLTAAANEPSQHSMYATETYANDGIVRGLREDFAEAWAQFFVVPRFLQDATGQRYDVIAEIVRTQFPEIDVEAVRKDIAAKLKAAARWTGAASGT